MNIRDLLEKQDELDNVIMNRFYKNGGDITHNQLLEKRLTALSMEVSEFIQSMGLFKYWKQHKNTDEDNQLEEFADILFFFLSIANLMEWSEADLIDAYNKKWEKNMKRQEENY